MDTMKTLPISTRIGTRAHRRRVVLALYAGYPLMVAALWGSGRLRESGSRPAAIIGVAVAVALIGVVLTALYLLLRRTVVNLPNIAERELDERQRRVRDGAYRKAYGVLVTLVSLVGTYVLYVAFFGGSTISVESGTAQVIWWAISIVTLTLPTAIIAWNEPNPDDE